MGLLGSQHEHGRTKEQHRHRARSRTQFLQLLVEYEPSDLGQLCCGMELDAPPRTAIADKACCLVVPFLVKEIDCILERSGYHMVVLCRYKDICVKRVYFCCPSLRVVLGVLALRRRNGFVKKREVKISNVYQLELCVAAFLGCIVNPFGYGLTVAPRTRASNDNCYLEHG